jgi:hypothetical protein
MTFPRARVLKEIYDRFRQIPGARAETRSLADVFEREVDSLRDAHRARSSVAAEVVRLGRWKLGRQPDSDAAILDAELTLEEAREAIAKFHWFATWSDAQEHAGERVDPRFERAADAIVEGDAAALRVLVADEPSLARARSPFAHHATLLQHVAANGIEVSRQWQSPANAVEIAKILLEAGAEPDATCDAYAPPPGASTAMTLLVSSSHPAMAGVQVALVEALLDAGACVDGLPTQPETAIETAVRFGYPAAAEALARRGARVDNVVVAAGLGRLDLVERLAGSAPGRRVDEAFRLACTLGRTEIARFLLQKGADAASQDNQGFTGLHWAAFHGHADTVAILLEPGAPLEVKNVYGGTVLDCTVWASLRAGLDVDYVPVVAQLLAAGADLGAVGPYPSDAERVEALLRAARSAIR